MLLAVYLLGVALFAVNLFMIIHYEGIVVSGFDGEFFLLAALMVLLLAAGVVIDLQKRRLDRATAQETSSGRVLDSLLRHGPAGIVSVGPDLSIEYISEKLLKDIGIEREKSCGKKCYEVLGSGKPCCGCPAERAFRTGEVHSRRRRAPLPANKEVYIAQTAIPVFAEDGTVIRVLEIVVPITNEVLLEKENNALFVQTAEALSKLIEERDTYTKTHSVGVRDWAIKIGRRMRLKADDLQALKVAATLHDIGKIGIPEAILNKPGRLTSEEYEIIQEHSRIGYNALKDISRFQDVAEYVLHHHEKYDGTGYPAGLSGEDIPLLSRILAVADVYEAITSDRVYRKAMEAGEARETIVAGRGSQFDPLVVDAFLRALGDEACGLKMA